MTDEMQNLVIELQLLRTSVDDLQTEVSNFISGSGLQFTCGCRLDSAALHAEIDHIKVRLDRVEKRLGLQD